MASKLRVVDGEIQVSDDGVALEPGEKDDHVITSYNLCQECFLFAPKGSKYCGECRSKLDIRGPNSESDRPTRPDLPESVDIGCDCVGCEACFGADTVTCTGDDETELLNGICNMCAGAGGKSEYGAETEAEAITCPKCGSDEVEGADVSDADEQYESYLFGCHACQHIWYLGDEDTGDPEDEEDDSAAYATTLAGHTMGKISDAARDAGLEVNDYLTMMSSVSVSEKRVQTELISEWRPET